MNDNALPTVEAQIRGFYHAGEQIVVAHGTANGAPMLDDTGFLSGSVRRVVTVNACGTWSTWRRGGAC